MVDENEIINIRKQKLKISQEKFSQLMSVSLRTVMRWESGENLPTGVTLEKLKLFKRALRDEKLLELIKEAIEYGNIHLVAMFITTLGSVQNLLDEKSMRNFTKDFIYLIKRYFIY
jgi:transcriptional regulator with XRE-family HTH domain